MLLKDYIPNVNQKFKNIFFSGISFESSKIKKNHIFFAIRGTKVDGNRFIPLAIKKGSKIIITEKKVKNPQNGILYIYTENVRRLLAQVSFKVNYSKIKNLVAVTGTNGKSSIVDFYYQILNLNNKKVASIGTLGVKSNNFHINLDNTTTDPLKLSLILKKLKSHNVENVIMEASSHGLKQSRLDGLKFDIGIFTNFSQDHLDYHKNLKDYLDAKLYLFRKLLKKKGKIITDSQIPEFKKIKKIVRDKNFKLKAINEKKNNFKIISHSFDGESQILKLKLNNLLTKIRINLTGKIQIKNILMAILAAEKSNLNLKKILKVVSKIRPVKGRLEKIGKIKNKSKVILDYAHTPDALKTCLLNLREQFPDKKISLLFGCGGNRDQDKRFKMGNIASKFSDQIYLTDDNPRFENPNRIRKDIKKGIKKKKYIEISNRARAIQKAIKELSIGEILLVAGKGHEEIQDIGVRKIHLSDKKIILDAIKIKNSNLSTSIKLNIIKQLSGKKSFPLKLPLKNAQIDSREIKKNDIFFTIKGKKRDGNKFVKQSFNKGASLAIVNKIQPNINKYRQIEVQNSLKFLTESSKIFRKNINTKIISITGSCGKTTLKELLGNVLSKISKTSISPKSFNNRFGVPLSLFNLKQNDDFGVLEVGMDKKGEIDYLSKIILPDVSVITNVNYAHVGNFRNIEKIALAKAEIIPNTKSNGFVVLNADDNFFSFHKKIALKHNLSVKSFGIKNRLSNIKLIRTKKEKKKFKIFITVNNSKKYFYTHNDFKNNIYNILAALTVISIYFNILKLNKNIFLDFNTPQGRGDFSRLKINNKNINLIDESYNSNPLSLKSAILNYDKIISKKSKKYLLLGDMLELGKHSKKLHHSIAPIINQTMIDKVFVKGKQAKFIFDKISKIKRGKILHTKSQINEFIKKDLNNNDYLLIKASNATGFNMTVKDLKGLR